MNKTYAAALMIAIAGSVLGITALATEKATYDRAYAAGYEDGWDGRSEKDLLFGSQSGICKWAKLYCAEDRK